MSTPGLKQKTTQLTRRSVYSLFSALIMHVYQMRSSNQSVVEQTQQRTTICMNALRDVSRVWLVAKMVHNLFESILGNKVLEERLQKAAGRRHTKVKIPNGNTATKPQTAQISPASGLNNSATADGQKRKFDDMEFGHTNGPPAPQMSYERSRPQSPALTPQPNPPPQQHQHQHPQMPQLSAGSPNPTFRPADDSFLSRGNTRPTTPFNPWGGTRPSTPEFFLHTRNSPKISDDLWQNYAPEQLFPSEINGAFSLQSPGQSMVDPALRGPPPQPPHRQYTSDGMQQQSGMQQMPMQHQDGNTLHDGNMQQHMMYNNQQDWSQMDMGQQRSDDTWSSSSHSGPIVPTTLNVGDWFEFFGIPNGDISALAAAGGLGSASGGGGYG